MSRGQGLAKLTGAPFTRIQPDLCAFCKFYAHRPEAGAWADQCDAKHKLLSNPHTPTGRCKEFEHAGKQQVSDELLQEWRGMGLEAQEYRNRRKRR
jgi:hypothetical protein